MLTGRRKKGAEMHEVNDFEGFIARRAEAQVAVSLLRDRVLQVISKESCVVYRDLVVSGNFAPIQEGDSLQSTNLHLSGEGSQTLLYVISKG